MLLTLSGFGDIAQLRYGTKNVACTDLKVLPLLVAAYPDQLTERVTGTERDPLAACTPAGPAGIIGCPGRMWPLLAADWAPKAGVNVRAPAATMIAAAPVAARATCRILFTGCPSLMRR